MTDRLHLSPRHRTVLEKLLRQHLPGVEVWAYGSRVNGRNHDGSDLDLVLRGPGLEEIPAGRLGDFKEAVRESNIPFLVEARDWARLPERFHREIEREYVVLAPYSWTDSSFGKCAMLVRDTAHPADFPATPYIGLEHIGKGTLSFASVGQSNEVTSLKSRFKAGDVLYGKIRPYFRKVVRPTFDGIVSTDIWVIRPKAGIDAAFLFYLVATNEFTHAATQGSEGTKMPRAKWDYVAKFPVRLPSLPEQRAIAHILGTLDDKIELNRRMNETLEALARSLFKDWFVDFGPVRAKMEGSAPYLPPEIWELFPDTLDDGGKPEGWVIYTLADLAHHHRAILSPSVQPERFFEHYSIPAYDTGNEPAIDLGSTIKSNKTIVPEGSVLLSKLNPEIERVWLPNPNREELQVASTEFLALTPLAPATRSVLYYLFRSPAFRAEMIARVTGTSKSHQRVSLKSLLICEVLAANPELLALFDEKVSPMLNRLLSNRRALRTLAQTRDTLLPKLISGEICVRDVETDLEIDATSPEGCGALS